MDRVQVLSLPVLADRTCAEGSEHPPFGMKVDDPPEGDEQRADGRGADEPEPERGARQQRRAQRGGEQRRAHSVAAHRDSLPI